MQDISFLYLPTDRIIVDDWVALFSCIVTLFGLFYALITNRKTLKLVEEQIRVNYLPHIEIVEKPIAKGSATAQFKVGLTFKYEENSCAHRFKIRNIGLGTAKGIKIKWGPSFKTLWNNITDQADAVGLEKIKHTVVNDGTGFCFLGTGKAFHVNDNLTIHYPSLEPSTDVARDIEVFFPIPYLIVWYLQAYSAYSKVGYVEPKDISSVKMRLSYTDIGDRIHRRDFIFVPEPLSFSTNFEGMSIEVFCTITSQNG